ncbi:hypothetical protein [Sphingosinicella sp. BN140058]|uniref:hypothetical protein n=1 Tax=Sphingosinicella sp. BN140058 TaxID=1892855 RepID=UPI001010C7F5|nr:hypothetical protein [Sphingosinicella sp. BN140058]QAY77970.1 hypothetical protein ETR14_16640 [Sphingosinicella sp. BN140058]
MNFSSLIAGATLAAAALVAGPVSAYPVKTTGTTRATPQLAADIIARLSSYSKATRGCSFVFSAEMRVMPAGYAPRGPAAPFGARGGHYEQWSVNACGKRQLFQIGMWPSPRGGADFAVTPLTAPAPLHGS